MDTPNGESYRAEKSGQPGDEDETLQETELPDFNEDDAEEIGEEQDDEDLEYGDDEEMDNGEDGEPEDMEQDDSLVPERDDAIIVLRDHKKDTLCVAGSPSRREYLITGGMDDLGKIWDLELGNCLATVDGFKESVSCVSFSRDGKLAAFGSENGAISIVYMDGSEAPNVTLDGPGDAIHFFAWHPRGPVLLAGSGDSVAYMWNAARGKFMTAFAGHEDGVTCGDFTADGKWVVTASLDSSVRVWNPATGETVSRLQTGLSGMRSAFHAGDIHALDVGREGTVAEKLIASGCAAGSVFISHRENAQVVSQLPRHDGGVETVSFSAAGVRPAMVATAGADGLVRVWDVEKYVERCMFKHGGVIAKVIWHPTKALLFSGSSNGTVAVWNVLSGEQVALLSGHTDFITDIALAGENELLASTSADGTVRVFDMRHVLSTLPSTS